MTRADATIKTSPSLRSILPVTLALAIAVQAGFVALAVRTTGRIDGFALRSSDSGEFIRLARCLARYGEFSQDQRPPLFPDTWRVPAYPLFLAACMRIFGEDVGRLILAQQVLAVLNVGLLVIVASYWMSTGRAGVLGAVWLLDPYRGYYSLWIMSETWFVTVLLVALYVWQRWRTERGGLPSSFVIGALIGIAVLTRPIASALVPVAALGVGATRGSIKPRLARVIVWGLGLTITLGPWLVRNKLVGGAFALSSITGPVVTYFKAVEVVLWERDLMAKRYDPKTVHETWERFDDRLRRRWASRHGLLTPALRREMSWPEITTGRVRGVNAFQLDREVLRLGLTILAEHPRATASCWTWRCVAILTFPLGLAVYPPDTPSALPLASLWPEAPLWIRRLLAAAMAAPFVILTFLAARRAIGLARSGRIAIAATCALPVLALLVATSPQVDPRFRVPMIPLLLLLAAARRSEPIAEATATSTGVPPSLDGQA